ncbi:MAG: response regulator [Nitrososphaeraceae archaeon]
MLTKASVDIIITQAKDYYPYSILRKTTSFYYSQSSSPYSTPHPNLQNQESNTTTNIEKKVTKDPFLKRILVVDDDPDITLTFKVGLEGYFDNDNNDKTRFEVYTYNKPLEALSEFKPNFYDILLVDVYMPDMNGFQFCEKILSLDVNVRVCFISAAELNIEALREVYPKVSFGCFMKKPVTIEYLVKRLLAELD